MDSYLEVVVFLAAAVGLVVVTLWMGALLRPHRPEPEKLTTYECGIPPFGDARVRWNIQYYIFALIFVVFDVETVFLYPWAVVFKELGLFGFIEMIIFILILVAGLLYAWKKRVLRWV